MSDDLNVSDLELFNSMLNSNWDDIEDLPEFKLLPIGSHRIRTTAAEIKDAELKDGSKTKAILIMGEYKGQLEGIDGDETPVPAEGSLCSQRFLGSRGIQTFKKLFADFLEVTPNPTALIDELGRGMDLIIVVNHTASKDKVDPETGKPVMFANWKTVAAVV